MTVDPLGQFINDMGPAAQTLTLKETILAESSPELLTPLKGYPVISWH